MHTTIRKIATVLFIAMAQIASAAGDATDASETLFTCWQGSGISGYPLEILRMKQNGQVVISIRAQRRDASDGRWVPETIAEMLGPQIMETDSTVTMTAKGPGLAQGMLAAHLEGYESARAGSWSVYEDFRDEQGKRMDLPHFFETTNKWSCRRPTK